MWQNATDSDSDFDDEDKDAQRWDSSKRFVLVVIDAHPLMFKPNEDKTTPFRNCLKACYSVADSLLFATSESTWNKFAVLLAGMDLPCLVQFDDNVINTTKLLKEKLALSDKELIDKFQRKGEFNLASLLLDCKKVFHSIKSSLFKRTLIYITDDDEPVTDSVAKFIALNEIKTFSANQINFQVVSTKPDFNYGKFYNEVFSLLDEPPLEQICQDKEALFAKLKSEIIRIVPSKVLFYPFKGDTSRFVQCSWLKYIQFSALINTKVTRDGKPVKPQKDDNSTTSYFFKCSMPGRDTIKFNSFEKDSLSDRSFPQGLTLLFVSKRVVDLGYVLGKPFFLKSDETDSIYNKFWHCCVKKERVLVCALKTKKRSDRIRCVELTPTTVNDTPMFLGKYIPFSNEIIFPREAEYAKPESDKGKKEVIRQLVNTMTFDFDLKLLPDVCYRKRKEFVKAKLLDEPIKKVDDNILNVQVLDDLLKDVVKKINENYNFVENKRKATPSTSKSKKSK